MGVSTVKVKVKKSREARACRQVRFLVDSSAAYSVVAGETLRSLGLKPFKEIAFTLPNGGSVRRQVGCAFFAYGEFEGVAQVLFGRKGDKPLLGFTALQALGLELDHGTGELRPMEMPLTAAAVEA